MRRLLTLAPRACAAALLLFVSVELSAQGTVSVTLAGNGAGTVRSTQRNLIDCGSDCSETFARRASVTLVAAANSGSTFSGWSGTPCTGTTPCIIDVRQSRSITATFATTPPTFALTVTASGAGVVTSAPPGIACSGGTCSRTFNRGAVRLLAAPRPDALFMGYAGGGCGSAPACTVNLTAPTTVTATFRLPILHIRKRGAGRGYVTSSPGHIRCPDADDNLCDEQFRQGDVVTLTANWNDAKNTFVGWGGDCSGSSPTCQVTMSSPRTVTATFDKFP